MAMPATVAGTQVPVTPGGTVDMNALLGGISDRVTGNFYYTLKLAAATSLLERYTLFNAALGDADPYPLSTIVGPPFPTLSKVETNIPSKANTGLTPPYDIVIDSVAVYVEPSTIKADLDILETYGYFEFAILSKVQWDGKFVAYPPGIGYSGFSTQSNESGWQIGMSDPSARKRFGHFGKYLAPNVQWSFNLFFPATSGPVSAITNQPGQASLTASNASPTPGVGTVIRAFMFGLLGRPVS